MIVDTNAQVNKPMCVWLSHYSFAMEAQVPTEVPFTTVPHAYNCSATLDNELLSVTNDTTITVKKSGLYRISLQSLFGLWTQVDTVGGSSIWVNSDLKSMRMAFAKNTDGYVGPTNTIEIGMNANSTIKVLEIATSKVTSFGWRTGETGMWWGPTGHLEITYLG